MLSCLSNGRKALLSKAFSPISQIIPKIRSSLKNSSLKNQTVEQLWPQWILDYTKLKAWKEKKGFDRRMRLGQNYVFPIVGGKHPSQITTDDVMTIIHLVTSKTEHTYPKVLTALTQFLRWCDARQLRDKEQRLPTDRGLIEPHLNINFKKPGGHHPAIDWRDIPQFIAKLHDTESNLCSKALLFTILTASRVQPIRHAKWTEFNKALKEWHIPAQHMKGKQGNNRPHDVPLSKQALEILRSLQRESKESELIFSKSNTPISDTAIRKCIRRIHKRSLQDNDLGFFDTAQNNRIAVTHGFRAAFATWAQETDKNMMVVERCLAHKDSEDKYNGAYRRGTQIKQRKKLLQQWADYCFSKTTEFKDFE